MQAEQIESLAQIAGVWRSRDLPLPEQGLPSGNEKLDAQLPGGGWPIGALTELLLETEGVGELDLLLPAFARCTREGAWTAFVAPPYQPFAPALQRAGVNLSHLLLVNVQDAKDRLWAAEQLLRSGSFAAVAVWPDQIDERALRRLQLAAERGESCGFVWRPASAARSASPAALRLRISTERGQMKLAVLKLRGARLDRSAAHFSAVAAV
ncbi:MAG: translesion DNA synthesis-associated protein ImuA [Gammaproteobacteria bacterium]|nr:translesion DNA synthesis-associated protein ImuA [Gammaproteobacteria bacterium]